MILENWEIDILKHDLVDYEEWIAHINNYEKFLDKKKIIKNKIQACFKRMKRCFNLDYTNLEDREIVELIKNQTDYKNRIERNNV